MKETRKVTSGIVFKSGTTRLGKTVFDVCEENQKQKIAKEKAKIEKDKQAYLLYKKASDKLIASGKKIEDMTIVELKTLVRPYKKVQDGAMPTKKVDLLAKYKEWSVRPLPSFNCALDEDDNLSVNSGTNENEKVISKVFV